MNNAAAADGLTHQAVVTAAGALFRGSGTTSATRSGDGQYQVVFNADVKACTYSGRWAIRSTARRRPARSP